MSIANLIYGDGKTKKFQKINVNEVNCEISNFKDCTLTGNLDIQGQLTNTLGNINVGSSLDFQNTNDAFNINNLSVDGLVTLSNTNLNNAATDLLVLDGNNVKYRTVTSLPSGGNPFDQDLNTTDSPQFVNLKLTELDDVSGGEIALKCRLNGEGVRSIDNLTSVGTTTIRDINGNTRMTLSNSQNLVSVPSSTYFEFTRPTFVSQSPPGAPLNLNRFILFNNANDGQNLYKSDEVGALKKLEFDQQLDTTDDVEFNSVTTPSYNITNPNDQQAIYVKFPTAIPANTDGVLSNWTTAQTSNPPNRVNVDPVTGIFTPETGLYSFIYQATITSMANVTNMGIRVVDELNNTIYESVIFTDDLFAPETGKEGSHYQSLVGYFIAGKSYTLHFKIGAPENVGFTCTISRIM